MKPIAFNIPTVVGTENKFLNEVLANKKFCGDGIFTKKATDLLQAIVNAKACLLTTSCTHALEMSAMLLNIVPGDEVIMPSYTFVSTANAFILRGAKIIFVDIEPLTMNINAAEIEQAITSNTKAIVVVHYAGVSCDMDSIMKISHKHGIPVVEDAAQAIGSSYNGKALGTIGQLGCISFHETKNLHCGEGGALIINDDKLIERAEVIREKGTNRKQFLMGMVDKYTWVDVGSSYLPSELNAAFLYAQLSSLNEITASRAILWDTYFYNLKHIPQIELQKIESTKTHFNAHIFFIKTSEIAERQLLINYLKQNGIASAFHYIPLHTAPVNKKYSTFKGKDNYTTKESERLLRLPIYNDLTEVEVNRICKAIEIFYN